MTPLVTVMVSPAAALDFWERFREQFGPVVPLPEDSEAGLAWRTLLADAAERKRDRYELSIQIYAFLMTWWRQMAQSGGGRLAAQDPIEQVMAVCRTQTYDRVTVKELADRVGLSREHFTRLFIERVGTSPAEWLRQQRLEVAWRLRRETKLQLGEIALRSGFGNTRNLLLAEQRALINPQNSKDL
jgi:AraC-like DNA-binding protein